MDEKEKDLAGNIFKICRALERISGSYFREEIDEKTFFRLFSENYSRLEDSFKIYLEG